MLYMGGRTGSIVEPERRIEEGGGSVIYDVCFFGVSSQSDAKASAVMFIKKNLGSSLSPSGWTYEMGIRLSLVPVRLTSE